MVDARAKVTAFPVFTKKKSIDICQTFIDGVPPDREAKGNVFFGVTEVNNKAWVAAKAQLKSTGYPYYYIDNSYFNKTRETYYRVTKNALQFQGPDYESDGKRWDALGYELKPWRNPHEGHIVVCPQSETYLRYTISRQALAKMWLPETLDMLKRAWPKREIRVREWSGDKVALSVTLHDDLAGAGLLVTHSSAAAIEAAIEGIGFVLDVGSPSAIASMPGPEDNAPDQRLKYMRALADNQWTLDEIKRGDAWRWLNR